MQSELQRRYEAAETRRAELKHTTSALGDAQLNWSPDAETWSARQIVQHLVLGDETVGRACEPGAPKQGMGQYRLVPRAWMRALALGVLNHNIVVPLPLPELEPAEYVALPELFRRWDSARLETRRVLEGVAPGQTPYSHPVVGPLTAVQMLDLEEAHTKYHMRQMERLMRLPGFPGTDG